MSWRGPELGEDERDLAAMLDSFAAVRDVVLDDERPEEIGPLIAELADLGVWTLGNAEDAGGGGATRLMTGVAWERISRTWPALGWASVQAHAAIDVLAQDSTFDPLVDGLHRGEAAVAVVDATALHVRLDRRAGHLSGVVERVDAAHPAPHLLVLDGDSAAWLVSADACSSTSLERCGLGGALTREVRVDATAGSVRVLDGVDLGPARTRLRFGAAIVAAGIAGIAADEALAYGQNRYQFGDRLTALPVVRASLFDQAAAVTTILNAALSGADDCVQAAAVARYACDLAVDATASSLQSHGGYGYLTEYAAGRRLRDAVSLRAAAGVDVRSAALELVGLDAHGDREAS